MKQTAVEWLVSQIDNPKTLEWLKKEIEQAKAMEKEQIKDAYSFGISDEYVIGSKQYYNETFKNTKQ